MKGTYLGVFSSRIKTQRSIPNKGKLGKSRRESVAQKIEPPSTKRKVVGANPTTLALHDFIAYLLKKFVAYRYLITIYNLRAENLASLWINA